MKLEGPSKINKEWHDAHRLPKNATRAQRVRWHSEHAEMCGCRPVPASLRKSVRELAEKGATR